MSPGEPLAARHEASLANLGFLGEVLVTNDALERIAHQGT